MSGKHISNEYIGSSDEEPEEYAFKAPRGYHKIGSFKPLANVKNLQDKEIWLIKAPKSFKFENVKSLPISFDVNDSSIVEDSTTKKTYKLQEDIFQEAEALAGPEQQNSSSKKSKKKQKQQQSANISNKYRVLQPSNSKSKADTLTVSSLPIKRFYSLSENVQLPVINHDKVFEERRDVEKIEGLRLRHFATGYTEADFGKDLTRNLDDLLDGQSAETQHASKKQKTNSGESVDVTSVPLTSEESKKPKKEKKDKSEKKAKKEKKEKKHKKEKKEKA